MATRIRVTLPLLVVVLSLLLGLSIVSAQDQTLEIWTKYNSESPQNSQDEWMAAIIEEYAADTGIALNNVTLPYDQIVSRLNVAALEGGDVPSVSYMDGQTLGPFAINGTLMDLTDFVTSAEWYGDLNPAGLAACTAPSGEILCVPTTIAGTLSYYWTDAFPNGFTGDTDSLVAERTTEYALTGKNSEAFAFNVFYFPLLASNGVQFAGENGMANWASEEAVTAIEFIRQIHADNLIPDTSLAAGFDYENAFKDGTAGAFAAGSWSYVFLNPLTSPDGAAFPADSTAVQAAIDSGDLAIAPPLHVVGGTPTSLILANGWSIPLDSPDPQGAMDFINWHMTTQRMVDYAIAYGGLPSLNSSQADEAFQSTYWQGVAQVLSDYGVAAPALLDFNAAAEKFANTAVDLIQNPDKDILEALQQAQDEFNAEMEASL